MSMVSVHFGRRYIINIFILVLRTFYYKNETIAMLPVPENV